MSDSPARTEALRIRATHQRRLAFDLYAYVYGSPPENWDAETEANYLRDADEILTSHPHLLPLSARVDMLDEARPGHQPGDKCHILPGPLPRVEHYDCDEFPDYTVTSPFTGAIIR